jgi:hypothetical protein
MKRSKSAAAALVVLACLTALMVPTAAAADSALDAADRRPESGAGVEPDGTESGFPRLFALPTASPRLAQAAVIDGQDASPAPLPPDALSGAASGDEAKPPYRLSGFFDVLPAYTYTEPAHWSRGVGRMQLTGQGELTDAVKWKLSGRVDGDLVYATSDFYLNPVKKNQRLDFFWGENYIDFSAGSWDFRLGAQQIVWGEVVGLFVADVVSAHDMREFLLPSFDLIRIPQGAARAEYTAGDGHVEFIWIPVPAFDRIGKPGADFYPAPLPSPTPAAVAALFQDPERPSTNLSNSNYGVRANALVGGWDLAAFYYRSFNVQPTFYRVSGGTGGEPPVFQPRYDRIWQAGATVSKDFDDFVMRGEAVYTAGQGFSVVDLSAAQSVVTRPTLDYILSFDFALPADTRLNVQGFQRVFFDGGASDLALKSDGFGASVLLSTKWTNAFEPQILWIQNFKDAGGLVRPRLNWYPAKNTTVAFGVDIFTGPADGYFGRYNNRDRVYSEVRYNF